MFYLSFKFQRGIMQRIPLILVLLCIAAGSVFALPSHSGLRGLNRVADARPAEQGILSIGLFTFLGISPEERTALLNSGEVEVTDTEYSGTGYLSIGYGVSNSFELASQVSYLVNLLHREDVEDRLDITGDWEGDNGFSEAGLSLKYTFNPEAEKLWFGIMPLAAFSVYSGGDNSFVYNGDGWDGIWDIDEPMFQMKRPMINSGSMSFGGDLLATIELDPVVLHGNLGYRRYNQNFTFTDRRYDAAHNVIATEQVDLDVADPLIRFAGGIEYPMNTTTLFAEVEWSHFLNREFEEGDGERFDDWIQIAPGARFAFESGLAMDVTASFCLSSFDSEYNDLGHRYFQQGVALTDEERARYAPFPGGYAPGYGLGINLMYQVDVSSHPSILSGTVTDVETGQTLQAAVSFPGSEAVGVNTDAGSGMYSTQLDQGTYNILVQADGYISASETVEIPGGENITMDFSLQSIQGTVTGTVTDAGTGEALEAMVAASAGLQTGTDIQGSYSIQCPAGARTFTASADSYSNQSRTVEVIAGETVVQDFQLGSQLNFQSVYFDYDKYELRSDAQAVLNQVADLLLSNPGVSILITGNADSDGTSEYNQTLAENRALAVRNYLISRSISEESLSTVSYGEERPAVPNSTDENKALNRRSEFIILGAPIQ
jgi:outer membrane protein OmpA-like peptidoglycan-associated protein